MVTTKCPTKDKDFRYCHLCGDILSPFCGLQLFIAAKWIFSPSPVLGISRGSTKNCPFKLLRLVKLTLLAFYSIRFSLHQATIADLISVYITIP